MQKFAGKTAGDIAAGNGETSNVLDTIVVNHKQQTAHKRLREQITEECTLIW